MEKQDYQAFGIAELGKLAPQLCGAAAKYAEKSKYAAYHFHKLLEEILL